MTMREHGERERFERFYERKWSRGTGLWEERYPVEQRAYAVSVYRRRNEAIARRLPARAGRMLDIGCGVGDVARLLAPRARQVVATDLSFVNVRSTRDNLSGAASVAQAGAERLPFADGSFDVVVLADVIEHIPDAATALAEVRRVLRSGGVLACATPVRATLGFWRLTDWGVRALFRPSRVGRLWFRNPSVYERFFDKRELGAMLASAGFRDLRFERICFYPAPETAGAFGALMRRVAARRPESVARVTDRAIAAFDVAARLRVGNQKQLWTGRA